MLTQRFKSLLLIAFAILITTSTMAQGAAEVWINKVTTQLQNKGAEINFRINEEGIRISGKLLMEGNHFHFDTDEMKIWYDGTTQWTLQNSNEYSELYISEPTLEDQQSINPYLLLKNYKESFTATDGGDKTIAGILLHEVTLTAKDDAQELSALKVYIKSSGDLAALHLIFPDDRVYKIDIRSMRSGLTFPQHTFTYIEKAYPANEVIDMR